MNKSVLLRAVFSLGLLALSSFLLAADSRTSGTRNDAVASLEATLLNFEALPENDESRSAYAAALFKLGNVWTAIDVITPLITEESTNTDNLALAARLALLTMNFDIAEQLYLRVLEFVSPESEKYSDALNGLSLVYYQQDEFNKAEEIILPFSELNSSDTALLDYMQRYPGNPYEIHWYGPEKVARISFINDYMAPGALPMINIEVNGHSFEFILDTGGNRLYLDEGAAEEAAIEAFTSVTARYAFTGGETIDQPLGVANSIRFENLEVRNVPTDVIPLAKQGVQADGIIGTQILKQFLTSIDYELGQIIFRERNEGGKAKFIQSMLNRDLIQIPFFLSATHLMFAKGKLHNIEDVNYFIDSGLAASMPIVLPNETTELLGLEKTEIPNQPYYMVSIDQHGLNGFEKGPAMALGNVFVEDDMYWNQGFVLDALISHQYLKDLGVWTIDFDTMSFYFPANAN
jgi:tetratricopeptide (TPR) repeat protein